MNPKKELLGSLWLRLGFSGFDKASVVDPRSP